LLDFHAGLPVNPSAGEDAAEIAGGLLGIEIVTAAADSTANVPLAAQSLIGRVDAYYVTTDNAVVSAIDSVLAASEEAGVPFLVADPTSLAHATLSAGFDYYNHGLLVGEVVARVLAGARPDSIPVTYQARAEVQLNLDQAARIGLAFPEGVIATASSIYYGGVTWLRDSN
jgi:putative ABC transport system substrate-binding protein